MNVRKPVDYSAMFAALDTLMGADLPQMELYCEIGWLVSSRQEQGAAVAAAEYLCGVYLDASGFSPRNLRRMREFYRAYADAPDVMSAAMLIGWTQNVIIMETDLTVQDKLWYIQAVYQFGWSKAELLRQINSSAHLHLSLDLPDKVCYTGENASTEEVPSYAEAEDHECNAAGGVGPAAGISSVLCLLHPQFLYRRIYPQSILVCGRCGGPLGVADGSGLPGCGRLWKTLLQEGWAGQPGVVFRFGDYRRNGYDFDSRYEEGLASYREKCVMDVLLREGPTLSKDLKRLAGFGGDGLKGVDTVITNLQMQTYITVHSFEYARDKHSQPYGWGIAKYAVTEDVLGADVTQGAYSRNPEESKERIVRHLGALYPNVFDEDLIKLLR